MHLSEGILPASLAALWTVAAAPFVIHSARRLRREPETRARFGVATALAFAVTLFPIPVPGLGATSHLCATPVLALLLGPSALALPMAVVLALQALLFAHGGITTLGANVFTLGVAGPWLAWGLGRGLSRLGLPRGLAVGVACLAGAATVYLLDALMLGWALRGVQSFGHWVKVALLGFAPVQAPLLVLEGALSAALVAALSRRQARLVPAWLKAAGRVPAAAVLGLLLLALPLRAQGLQGLDEKVMEASARQAGRHPEPWLDLTEGEGGLALFMAGGLVAGFLLGRHWERFSTRKGASGDAPSA